VVTQGHEPSRGGVQAGISSLASPFIDVTNGEQQKQQQCGAKIELPMGKHWAAIIHASIKCKTVYFGEEDEHRLGKGGASA